MPFGQYDSDNNSMDTLGLGVNGKLYEAVDGRDTVSEGRYAKRIVLFSIILVLAAVMIGITTSKLSLVRRLVNHGAVTEAVYSGSEDAFTASISLDTGAKWNETWSDSWMYVKSNNVMPVYYLAEGNNIYATPQISGAVWAVSYAVPGVIFLIALFFLVKDVRGLLALRKAQK